RAARELPAEEIFVMDSGMAAILGASLDVGAAGKQRVLTLDLATSHTVGAVLEEGKISGFFEYHTEGLKRPRLEELVKDLADGNLTHSQILSEGGHGAYTRRAPGFSAIERIVVTGPRRGILEEIQPPWMLGAPFGDNMMTGTVGVLEAIRRRKGLSGLPLL
ncbi:MAG: pyruvate formate-lyase activating enzyme, partial [Deltaproteobacteria bacterium]|nr:pyruvate formate-lyase activating enzyme [Deltaproteobacteria bacterium]